MRDLTEVDWRGEEERGCTRKRRYPEDRARKVAASANAEGNELRAYPCPWHAGHWHTGHTPSLEALERLAAALRARRAEVGHDTPDPRRPHP